MENVKPLYIVGAGGMGRETFDLYRVLGRAAEVKGFLVEDRFMAAATSLCGLPIIAWSRFHAPAGGARFIVAIGSPERTGIIAAIAKSGGTFDTVIHPSVHVGPSVTLGEGCIVMPGAVFTVDSRVGAHTIVNVGVTISHDVTVGSVVTLSPGVNLAGLATIEDDVFVGAGAVVIPGMRVGKGSVIGAGAVVTRDIPPGVTAVGVPARPL